MRGPPLVGRWRRWGLGASLPVSTISISAPARKHRAPSAVVELAIAALTGSPVDGSISEARADTPKAIEPSMFSATIHHESVRLRKHTQALQTSA